jgi:hypothetical protein
VFPIIPHSDLQALTVQTPVNNTEIFRPIFDDPWTEADSLPPPAHFSQRAYRVGKEFIRRLKKAQIANGEMANSLLAPLPSPPAKRKLYAGLDRIETGFAKYGLFPSRMGRKIAPGKFNAFSSAGLMACVIGPENERQSGYVHTIATVDNRKTYKIRLCERVETLFLSRGSISAYKFQKVVAP